MNSKKPGALFALFLLLFCTVLTWFFVAGEDFYDYTSSTIEGAAQTAALDKDALTALTRAPKEKFDTEIKFRNFFITAPGAKKVQLLADFNGWGKTPIELTPYRKGYFETSLALSAGEYKYVFLVDGKEVPDPANSDRVEENGRTVCIKTVR